MAKLPLDYIRAEAHFIKRGGGHRSEAMNRRALFLNDHSHILNSMKMGFSPSRQAELKAKGGQRYLNKGQRMPSSFYASV
jgi:hypothetical protein